VEPLTLSEIAGALGSDLKSEAKITGVSTDSRTIRPGSLFVALRGEHFDGHDFLAVARAKGAAAFLVDDQVVQEDINKVTIIIKDTRVALLQLAGYYRSKFDIPLVGVTGSVGKTSTKEMVFAALSAKYDVLKTKGNRNNEIGLSMTILELDRTTQAAVIEMGMNHFGEISGLSHAAKPTVGIITNIGVSHIENLGSREGILQAKLEIVDGLLPGSPLILNADDDLLVNVKLEHNKIITYSVDNPNAEIRAEKIASFNQIDAQNNEVNCRTTFDICYGVGRVAAEIPVIGRHHVSNALAAFAAGLCCRMQPDEIVSGLKNFASTGMRQNIRLKKGITFLEDCYNASPDSIKAAIQTLMQLDVPGKRVVVLADMLELGGTSREEHTQIGAYLAHAGVDGILATGNDAKHYVNGAREAGHKQATFFEDGQTLANRLGETLCPGDAVLFKASRGLRLETVMEMVYTILEVRK